MNGAPSGKDIDRFADYNSKSNTEQEMLQTLVDNIPVMISLYTANGKVGYLNRAFEQLTGWTADEWLAMNVMDEIYPDREYRREVWDFMSHPGSGWKDIIMRTKSGVVMESSWTNRKLPDGNFMGIGIDITDRKRTEMELRNYRDHF